MAEKKGSKNAIENRGLETFMVCRACGDKRNPFKMIEGGRSRMVYECKCGLSEKGGRKIV